MQKKLNVKIKRLKSGGFVSSGTDAGDLQILRTAKNIDDGSGMKSGGYVKKMKKGKKIKVKKIPAVPMDDSLRFDKGVTRGPNPSAFIEGTRVPFGRSPTIDRMKKGGKAKSRVNEAGNYTKPGLRKSIFNRIKAGGKGGRPGQWSARKAQMMAKAYKKAGGGYK